MQLVINGEERYLNKKDAYMKSPLLDTDFKDGFGFKLACHKRTEVTIKSLMVMEYTDEPEFIDLPKSEFIYAPTLTKTDKPMLEDCIKDLSPELVDCIHDMDKHLKALNFKRKIEGGYPISQLTYVLPLGLSYKFRIDGNMLWHQVNWIRYNTKQDIDKFGRQKADYTEETLTKLAEESPVFAEGIFSHIRECFGCAPNCIHSALYKHNGKSKLSCTDILGGIHFKMIPSDFDDVKKIINVIIELSKEPLT